MNMTKTLLRKLYPKRDPRAHKGQFGRLLIIGGSKMYSGSPGLAALAAIRSGCDLVTVAAPQRAADIIAGFGPDLITWPLRGDFINPWHLPEILKLAGNATALVIGGGLGRHPQTAALVHQLLRKTDLPCVIDADGLWALSRAKKLKPSPSTVLTPHAGEFELLSGINPSGKMSTRADQVKAFARKTGCTVLLKGRIDIISDGRDTATNHTGNPQMTKGGTGDTLAGIAGALLARETSPMLAACAAAYINGLAGDLAAKEFGESLMALDLVNCLPRILKF